MNRESWLVIRAGRSMAVPPLLAVLAGLLAASAFAPLDLGLGILLGPWLLHRLLVKTERRFLAGFLYGLALMAPLVYWLAAFHPLGPWGALVLSAIPYALAARVTRGPVSFAAAMTAAEFFRSSGVFAFPWGVAGSVLFPYSLAALAPWIGLYGLSFALYLVAAFIRRRPVIAVAVTAALVLASALPGPPSGSSETLTIGVVQGNFRPEEDYEFRPAIVFDELTLRTRGLARRGADLVVWSETVILEYLNLSGLARSRIQALADQEGVAILVGAPSRLADNDKRNSIFFFEPGSAVPPARYDKVHLVPFGEYLPGYGPDPEHIFLPEGVGDFTPAPLPLPVGRLGLLVCYEGAFPGVARALSGLGATILVNCSNDAWAASAVEAHQHANLMRLRAFETRRPFVRAGNAGESFIADADGRLLARLGANESGEILAEVRIPAAPRGSSGDWVGILALLALPFLLTIRGDKTEDGLAILYG